MVGLMHSELPKLYEQRDEILRRMDEFRAGHQAGGQTMAEAEAWLELCEELRDVQVQITAKLRESGMPV